MLKYLLLAFSLCSIYVSQASARSDIGYLLVDDSNYMPCTNVLNNDIYQKQIPIYGDSLDTYIYGPTGNNPYQNKNVLPGLDNDYDIYAPNKDALLDKGHMSSDGCGGYYLPNGDHLRSDGRGGYYSKDGHIVKDRFGTYHLPDGNYVRPNYYGGYNTQDGDITSDGFGGYYLPDGKHMIPDGFGGYNIY